QCCSVHGRYSLHQVIGESPPDDRAQLRHQFRRCQAIQPRHQRVVQRRGDRQRWQRACEVVAVLLLLSRPDSSTTLVSSSTNSGTPSVLRTISASTVGGKALFPATCVARRVTCAEANRRSVSAVRYATMAQGG